jgi:hypothetical protein
MGLDVLFDNIWDWKGRWKKAGDVTCMKAYVTNDEVSH